MQALREFFHNTAVRIGISAPHLLTVDDQDLSVLERNLALTSSTKAIAEQNDRVALGLNDIAGHLRAFSEARQHKYDASIGLFSDALEGFAHEIFVRKYELNEKIQGCINKSTAVNLIKASIYLHEMVEHELSNFDLRRNTVKDIASYQSSLKEFCALTLNVIEFGRRHDLDKYTKIPNEDFMREAMYTCYPDLAPESTQDEYREILNLRRLSWGL